MEYVLKTNSLCKNYGHFKALNGLSMNVPKGSIYGLIGKNGAGKTTLIRLICGLQEPTSGDYVLYGKKHIDNHTDSDWCLCIGRFSVLPLLLRQFQEAPAPSKAGKNDTGK